MPKLLLAPEQRGWPHFQRLMIALLSFLEPYLRNADLTEAIRMLYKVRTMHCRLACQYFSRVTLGFLQASHLRGQEACIGKICRSPAVRQTCAREVIDGNALT